MYDFELRELLQKVAPCSYCGGHGGAPPDPCLGCHGTGVSKDVNMDEARKILGSVDTGFRRVVQNVVREMNETVASYDGVRVQALEGLRGGQLPEHLRGDPPLIAWMRRRMTDLERRLQGLKKT